MTGGAAKSSWLSNSVAGIAAMNLVFREITKANRILHGAVLLKRRLECVKAARFDVTQP